ncbi:MauE/DoxX family redox-associated membrane protein [Dinghuibacter silviterrae]|uniref:Methylamine utilization protein MauE n=1 Tax=Dinghuibacter silviterrae TaxID=1539049 RepID=A0A4V3GKT7_9BACT|nr:MauE/DoxX family redox-associated membrane protein [Dinghuibacter silviterrae]TDW96932.1 methylamine utilization protein MauE [Dinghuibacter silviterrae]
MKRIQVVRLIASFFVVLFLYAALSKLKAYDTFVFQLNRSPFVSRYAGWTAWSLPLGEILVALVLLIPSIRLLGLFASLFLMSLFTAYIFVMTHYSYYIPCSCGGVLNQMSWGVHFYFNIGCMALAVAGIFLSGSRRPPKTEAL